MSTESIIIPKVTEYFSNKGWSITREVKLRGIIPDIVATKDGTINVIEVKASAGDIHSGIEQALHLKRAANLSYLVIPKERVTKQIIHTCRILGIGLMIFDGRSIRELAKPIHSDPLPSVRRKIFGLKTKKESKKKASVKSSLEYLFRSKGQILILKLFFMHPDNDFHVHGIARRTGLSASYVTKELSILKVIGLVNWKPQGNLVVYTANNKSIIFDELKRIFIKYELLDEIIAKELRSEQIKYALIYGSIAKGTESGKSDIDLLVIGDINEDSVLKSIMRAQGKISHEINLILWKEKEFLEKAREKVPLLMEIYKNPILMVLGDEDEFKRTIERTAD